MYETSKNLDKVCLQKKIGRKQLKHQPTRKGYILYDCKYQMFCKERLYGDRKKKKRNSENLGTGRQDDEWGNTGDFQGTETMSCDEIIVHTCHVRLLKHSKFIMPKHMLGGTMDLVVDGVSLWVCEYGRYNTVLRVVDRGKGYARVCSFSLLDPPYPF